jgi:hypothetical protein
MNAAEVARWLQREWPGIRDHLGDRWPGFLAEYRTIVTRLREGSGRDDVERVADDVCDLLCRDTSTRRLLQGWQGAGAERLLASARETLDDREFVRQVCNRFQELVTNEPAPDPSQAEEEADESGQGG